MCNIEVDIRLGNSFCVTSHWPECNFRHSSDLFEVFHMNNKMRNFAYLLNHIIFVQIYSFYQFSKLYYPYNCALLSEKDSFYPTYHFFSLFQKLYKRLYNNTNVNICVCLLEQTMVFRQPFVTFIGTNYGL